MAYTNQLLEKILTTSDLLNFIGILFTAIISLYIFKSDDSKILARERHDKLIFPLFNLLEPSLYQNFQTDILNAALKIIETNRNLADGDLLNLHYLISKSPSKDSFIKLCTYVDKSYDKSCRKLGLKTRSATYRILRHQYKNVFQLLTYLSTYLILSLFTAFFFMLFFLYAIFILYSFYLSLGTTTQNIFLIIGMIFCILFLKYCEKKL